MISVQSRYFRSGTLSVIIWTAFKGKIVAAVTRPNLLESVKI